MRLPIAAISLTFLAACTSPLTGTLIAAADRAIVLLGERHDDPSHHRLEREIVEALAGRRVLAALALEMADRGASTSGLPPGADEAEVRRALRWDPASWPWAAYGPTVMAAVAAGIPVVGATLERPQLRAAMADASLDGRLPGPALQAQRQAIREGHCGLLADGQIGPMTRMQIARDRTMAQTLAGLAVPGKTVLLIAGAAHVDPDLGVPQHLPPGLASKSVVLPAPAATAPKRDHCEQLRLQWKGDPVPVTSGRQPGAMTILTAP